MKQKLLKLLGVVALVYFTMTPTGAVRWAVFRHGYPVHAMVFDVKDEPYKVLPHKNQTVYSLENPPFEEITRGELYNWVATKYGPFYIGSYYGWG